MGEKVFAGVVMEVLALLWLPAGDAAEDCPKLRPGGPELAAEDEPGGLFVSVMEGGEAPFVQLGAGDPVIPALVIPKSNRPCGNSSDARCACAACC